VLRTRSAARPLTPADRDEALALCARDPSRHVFVAARILESARAGSLSGLLGHRTDGQLDSVCWANANIVPVETGPESRAAFAERMRRWRGNTASVLGPREEVEDLWPRLEPLWGPPRAVRVDQPLMVTGTLPSALGVAVDERVRPAREDEVDAVLPAASHMFTHEIGYPPYVGSSRAYRAAVGSLVARGHTWVLIERGEVLFKTDIGSLALGCAQLQGVWLAPRLRGRGRSLPLLASVVEQLLSSGIREVSLYVNDYNTAARALYTRSGFRTVGSFTTVLL
jgi:predicted GNAT family acetyltransferase